MELTLPQPRVPLSARFVPNGQDEDESRTRIARFALQKKASIISSVARVGIGSRQGLRHIEAYRYRRQGQRCPRR
jgi:hypothetical protein